MPIPDLSSINKQVSDSLKTWLPKITDPEYVANTPVGKAGAVANVLTTPGLGLAAYGISKLRDTKFGKDAFQAVEDTTNAVNFPLGPELKITNAAVPATLMNFLWTEYKPGKYNYHKMEGLLDKYAQQVSGLKGVDQGTLKEAGLNKVVEALQSPTTEIPTHLHKNPEGMVQYVLENYAHPEINKLAKQESRVLNEVTSNSKGEEFSNLDKAVSQARNPEQAVIKSQETVDTAQQQRIETAGGIFDKVLSPKMRAILQGKMNRDDPSTVAKSLEADPNVPRSEKVSGDLIRYYMNRGGIEKTLKPIREAENVDPTTLPISDLQSLVKAKRKMLGPADVDKTIETLRRHGTTDQDTLTLMRRFLIGAQPTQLYHGKSEDIVKQDILLRVNSELEKLFKVKGN